jgi:hypothetical protein
MKKTKFEKHYGCGSIEQVNNRVFVSYRGNMGTGMSAVDEMVGYIFPGMSVQNLKNMFEVIDEDGYPSYSYCLTLKMPRAKVIDQLVANC